MTIPFGKHRGRQVHELPDDYLQWLLRVCRDNKLRDAVGVELMNRAAGVVCLQIPARYLPVIREAFDRGYRSLARERHPDVGGNVEAMRELNQIAEAFRGQLVAVTAA